MFCLLGYWNPWRCCLWGCWRLKLKTLPIFWVKIWLILWLNCKNGLIFVCWTCWFEYEFLFRWLFYSSIALLLDLAFWFLYLLGQLFLSFSSLFRYWFAYSSLCYLDPRFLCRLLWFLYLTCSSLRGRTWLYPFEYWHVDVDYWSTWTILLFPLIP